MIFDGCDKKEDMKCMVEDIIEWLLNCGALYFIQRVLLEKALDLLCGWQNWGPNLLSDKWNLVLLSLLWTIWKERNRLTFEDVKFTSTQLLASFITSLYEWSFVSRPTDSNYVQFFIE